ncbi:S28 family serine protease [Polyangium sp. 15x6]|uniref:S28 family serine protease n=2 Tax=Polyangium TaxID=55 RepID=UPI002499EA89|nr:S28 family serine protease [Polyangium sp. 15x6]MDI3285327.1 S28 family serine protease [Polyangium sp. 15x6]
MRTLLLPLLTITLASLSLVACGGDDTHPDSGTGGAGGSGGSGGAGGTGGSGGAGGSGGSGGATSADIFEKLQDIEGLTVTEEKTEIPGYRYFVLTIDQPADHDDPSGARFEQRLVLHHRDPAAPVVLATQGYNLYPEYQWLDEPAELLAANQVRVEHRFFTPSRPEPADWSQLTIEQAAADLHHIVEVIRPLYEGKWISTGGSKGGMTSVYHRRFYPDDVNGTVAYVAPHNFGDADPRYLEFVAQRGDAACQQALLDFQREVLLRRPEMLTRMQAQAADAGLTYELLGEDQALETAVIEFIFSFWQYGDESHCAEIPSTSASDDEVWSFFDLVCGPSLWSDGATLAYEPYYWQAAVQLGYPGYAEENVADLLLYPGFDVAASYTLPGRGKNPILDPQAMQDVSAWLTTEGERMMFIYGENDPYTAAAFDLGGAQDSYRFFEPAGNHSASIGGLPQADLEAALAALQAWTGVTPVQKAHALAAYPSTPRWMLSQSRRRMP